MGTVPERVQKMIELYKSGGTLQTVGRAHGVCGERVRQLFKRHGYAPRNGVTREQVLTAIATPGTKREIAKRLGLGAQGLRAALRRLKLSAPVFTRPPPKYSDEDMLDYMRALAEKLGWTPGKIDLDRHSPPGTGSYQLRFGSLTAAQRLAGLAPNKRGRTCLLGYGTDELRAELHRRSDASL